MGLNLPLYYLHLYYQNVWLSPINIECIDALLWPFDSKGFKRKTTFLSKAKQNYMFYSFPKLTNLDIRTLFRPIGATPNLKRFSIIPPLLYVSLEMAESWFLVYLGFYSNHYIHICIHMVVENYQKSQLDNTTKLQKNYFFMNKVFFFNMQNPQKTFLPLKENKDENVH